MLILGLGAALVAAVRWLPIPGFDAASRFLASSSAIALTCLLLVGWLAFFSGASIRARGAALGVLVLLALGAVCAVRIDNRSGDMVPSFTWRWTPKQDLALVGQTPAAGAGSPHIELPAPSEVDFPQFLGPRRNAVVEGLRLDRQWQVHPPRELWRQPIGAGWSAFAVVGDYAFTQEQRGQQEMVTCYEVRTGRLVWSHADAGRFTSVVSGDGPRSTPTIADGCALAMGPSGLLNCLDAASGRVRWSRNVLTDNEAVLPETFWGKSCSPLVVDGLVVVSASGNRDRALVAYRLDDGTLAWHGGAGMTSYSSPMLATLAGRRQIIIVNEESVAAHDPADGRVLWEYAWTGIQPKVPQPLPLESDRLLLSAGYGVGCVMLHVQPGDERGFTVQPLWTSRELKPKLTNPVVHQQHAYGLDDGRALVCLDLATGRRTWRGGRYGHGQVLLADDVLLVQTESGELVMVEATPERFHEIARREVFSRTTWNTPALAGRHLLMRNDQEAVCLELTLAAQAK